jgi:alpha-1,4-glucan:alpha-1,4-glucan 6-glycosyltransferase
VSRVAAEAEIRALHDLAAAAGVTASYTDGLGQPRTARPEVVLAVLQRLGVPIERVADAGRAAIELAARGAGSGLEPVIVAWDGTAHHTTLRLRGAPPSARGWTADCLLELEDGSVQRWEATLVERGPSVGTTAAAAAGAPEGPGAIGQTAELTLPAGLPLGYHRLVVQLGRDHWDAIVVSAPRRAHRGVLGREERPWGVFLPLHALRTARTRGIGDLSDLDALAAWAGGHGATVVGTLPLLAGYAADPCEPSPYLPVSRRFWHELHVDELAAGGPASSAPAPGRLVDHEAAMRARRAALEALAAAPGTAWEAELARFRTERPLVDDYARFRAAVERHGHQWRRWPQRLRSGLIPVDAVDPDVEHLHRFAQCVAEHQVRELAARLDARGQALYLDLPVGVHGDGFDVWHDPHLFVTGISVGAPPDPLFTGGQSWGQPPLDPAAARASGHAYLRECIAHHVRHAGVLRIDHVMGLHRLYWVPDGAAATDGVYVRYPAEEQWAVVCLESHRHRCAVVGEDLGTVPPDVDDALADHGVGGMVVGQFWLRSDPWHPLRELRPGKVASLNTHDTPTFAGFWAGDDLDRFASLGLLDPAQLAVEQAARDEQVEAVATWAGSDDAAVARDRLLTELAAGEPDLVVVNVEDLWLEPEPQNVPGTAGGANWRRTAAHPLEAFDDQPGAAATLAAVAAARARSTEAARRPTGPEPHDRPSGLTADDLHLFNEGRHSQLHDKLGAHPGAWRGRRGTAFAVWAPDAARVSVVGPWNGWRAEADPLEPVAGSGIWDGFVPDVGPGELYKFHVESRHGGHRADKADPFAFAAEVPPRTASVVADLSYTWGDAEWMAGRHAHQRHDRPMSIYEVHLGSWRRVPEEGGRSLTYREIAGPLADHVADLGFTHVELLPVMEHPFYGSWGYQGTGYFAPTSRYGAPQGLMHLIDQLHQRGIGVILDWVPSHFPSDPHGLAYFDGTHLYEHRDPRQRIQPDWGSYTFNYGRREVRSFLLSNAVHWLERFHADGLRVDAVASMLYLDYSRREGEWIPNRFGGRENLEAVSFLQECNAEVYRRLPDITTIAEESTAWPGVSRPVDVGGLGFGFKWDMGWMHDTLQYLRRDPVHRGHHHHELTFRSVYAWSENFVLPLSHDEVVHGKGSLASMMPGDEWQQRANLRLLLGWQHAQPGKKLLFMGSELGQWREWDHESSIDWHLLDHEAHAGTMRWVRLLNRLHRDRPALHELDTDPAGFRWVVGDDDRHSVYAFLRFAAPGADGEPRDTVLCVVNATPVPRHDYRIGVPGGTSWTLLADGDAGEHGGSGHPVEAAPAVEPVPAHGQPASIVLTLPPLAVVLYGKDHGPSGKD